MAYTGDCGINKASASAMCNQHCVCCCCAGSYISQINGQVQLRLAALRPVCSNGAQADVVGTPAASYPSQPWTDMSPTGYDHISIRYADEFGVLSITLGNSTTYGDALTTASTATLACPPGHKAAAMYGTHLLGTPYILTLGVRCSAGERRIACCGPLGGV